MQIILNAILSKDRFEYILVDKKFKIYDFSLGVNKYFKKIVQNGEDVTEILPELVGSEKEIEEIFRNKTVTYELESVYKNDQYVNLSVEHYNEDILLILLHNITDKTVSQQKILQYSNESILLNSTLQKILDSQNALVFVTNNNEISYTNEQFLKYFGVKRVSDIKRNNLRIYTYLDNNLESYDALFERVNSKEEYILINKDTFILQATWIESTNKLFTLTKVTNLSNKIQIDTLTGVYKKAYFNTYVEHMIRKNEEGVLVVLDIDNFKLINDTYGHQTGDHVLKEFAMLIHDNIRSDDVLARWGGDEFLLLLQHTSKEFAFKKLENLRILVSEHTFNEVGHLTASFGVAWKEENDDLHSLLQRADRAVYEAKKSGKNCVKFKKKIKA